MEEGDYKSDAQRKAIYATKAEKEKKNEEKRPDYPDVDKDGDREESMEKALKDKEKNEKKRSK